LKFKNGAALAVASVCLIAGAVVVEHSLERLASQPASPVASQEAVAEPGQRAQTMRPLAVTKVRIPVPAERGRAEGYRPSGSGLARDVQCLTEAVYYEARGESAAGQAAVAQVILNRVRHPSYPKTVCGVVYQRARSSCQFSFACDGAMSRRHERGAWNRAHAIATRALSGFVMSEVGAATHFHATRVAPNWGPGLLRVSEVGLHVFYRLGRGAPMVTRVEAVGPQEAEDVTPADDVRLTSGEASEVSAPVEVVTPTAPQPTTQPVAEAKPAATPASAAGADAAVTTTAS
jgi:spore germination cell wall hydrolase CwlJ-like protein